MSRRRSCHIFVLIDALGWRFLEGREFLSDVLRYRTPLRTVLGFSSGAIPTILTGVPPAQTGHWNLFYFDPEGSPFRWLRHFSFLPNALLDHRVTRKLLKETGRRILKLGPLFECCVSPRLLPWFNWTEKRNIYDRGGIVGARSIFDQLAEERVPYRAYSYHHSTDREILKQVRNDLKATEASFFFVYLSEIDLFLHHHCTDRTEVDERLGWYAEELRGVYDLAQEIDPQMQFVVFSDHGMTPVEHGYDLVRAVESLGFRMPADYLAVYDSTMARFWFFSERARRETVARLEDLPCGRIVSDEELRDLGVWFADQRYGELIYLLHPGWLVSRSDFNGNGWMPVGMHGYHPDDPYSDAVFLSNREPAVEPRSIADVHECFLGAMSEVGRP